MPTVIESLSMTHLFFATGVISLAYLVRGITGFGSGLIAIPLLALVMPLTTAVPLVVFLDYMASASHGINHREAIQWKEISSLLPFAIIGVITALFIFQSVDMEVLKLGLGTFVLLFALYSLFSFSGKKLVSSLWSVPAGSLGGMIGTLYGTGGPFYVIYLRFRKIEKTQFRATFATLFLLDGAGRLAGFVFTGFFTMDLVLMTAVSIPLMVIGMFIGGHIHTNISQHSFQRAISILLVFSGLALLLK
jgi:uncharacterized membrane protein YfcA